MTLGRLPEALVRRLGWPVTMALKGWWYGLDRAPRSYIESFARLAVAEPNLWRGHQDRLLSELLAVALARAPFYAPYRHLAEKAAASPREVLARLPIITKATLRQAQHDSEIPGAPARAKRTSRTGGSTGEPTTFVWDRAAGVIRHMSLVRAMASSGWRPGEGVAYIWGTWDCRFAHPSLKNRLLELFLHGVVGALDAFDLGPTQMARFLALLERRRPTMLCAYPNAADHFARWLEAEGALGRARALGVKVILSSAENLLPSVRHRLESVFGCAVFDNYGTSETGMCASECERHDGLHVVGDSVLVELVDDDGAPVDPGQPGRVVVTDLWNRCFAFVRYDLGDRARWRATTEPCPCGTTYPRLERIQGRQSDLLVTIGGRHVHGEFVSHVLKDVEGIAAFQLIQHTLETFTLNIVGDRARVERRLPAALVAFRRRLPGAEVEAAFVDQIPMSPRGKRRFTLCEVPGLTQTGG